MGEAKWRRDNPELARAAADKDRAGLLDYFRKKGMPPHLEYGESGQLDFRNATPKTLFNLEIGQRGNHSRRVAEAAAKAFQQIAAKAGPGMIVLHLTGYDDDPRELWDISEAADYVRLWASLAFTRENDLVLLHGRMIGFLAACGAFGDEVKREVRLPKKVTEQ
jgi:hypothetical protein